ncbi:hypothetical protein V1477_004141 [Vespula maculifrons]|uniref:Uncharacterized protein n=1 Tax=Vespula maculifrons TaxID=7453 RepID=A0ABD2CRW4_VESMC
MFQIKLKIPCSEEMAGKKRRRMIRDGMVLMIETVARGRGFIRAICQSVTALVCRHRSEYEQHFSPFRVLARYKTVLPHHRRRRHHHHHHSHHHHYHLFLEITNTKHVQRGTFQPPSKRSTRALPTPSKRTRTGTRGTRREKKKRRREEGKKKKKTKKKRNKEKEKMKNEDGRSSLRADFNKAPQLLFIFRMVRLLLQEREQG